MEYNSPTSVEDHKDSVREYDADPHPLIAATNPLVAQKHKLVLTHTIDSVHEWSENQPPSRKVSKESEESASYVHMADSSGQLSCLCPQCSSQRMHRTSGNSVSSSAYKSNSRKVSDEAMPPNAQVVSDERRSANVEMVLDEVSAPEHSQVVSSEEMLQYGDDLVISEITVVSSSHRVEFTASPQYDNSGILSESASNSIAEVKVSDAESPESDVLSSHKADIGDSAIIETENHLQGQSVQSDECTAKDIPKLDISKEPSQNSAPAAHEYTNWPQNSAPSENSEDVVLLMANEQPTTPRDMNNTPDSHPKAEDSLAKELTADVVTSEAPNSQMSNLLCKSTLENNTTSPVANAQPHTPNNMDQLNCKMNTVSTKEDLSTSSEVDSYPLDNKCKRQYYDTESPSSLTRTVKCDKDAKHIEVKGL